MPRLTVKSRAQTTASPDQCWAVVRDFCVPWHPAVDTMAAERGPDGALIRRFTVQGDATVYRERLTYFSESDRRMAYVHVEGIAGVERYEARLSVAAMQDGARVTMQAAIDAPSPRAEEIAEGTRAIFDSGTQTIAEIAKETAPFVPAVMTPPRVPMEILDVHGTPDLGLSAAGGRGDTLCLFLHGIGGNRTNWDAQLAVLAPLCRVAALDLRGYGNSALGPDQTTIDDYCADILRVMDTMGARRLILCGLSYGSWIATSFAMRYPDRLAALVLSGGCTGMSEAGEAERDAFRQSREVPLHEGKTPADFAPAVLEVIAGPEASEADRNVLLVAMAQIESKTYADALRCFTRPTETFDFSKLNLPVLMMSGEYDRLAPPNDIRGVAERIWKAAPQPDVRFEVIAGAGHVCNIEKPGRFNAILTEFVSRVLP